MTKEEAREAIRKAYGNSEYTDEIIKALEPELYEDCISRKEAILDFQRHGVGCFDPDDFSVEQCTRFVISRLNKLKSVYPLERENE